MYIDYYSSEKSGSVGFCKDLTTPEFVPECTLTPFLVLLAKSIQNIKT
jgi:hypothetical protein